MSIIGGSTVVAVRMRLACATLSCYNIMGTATNGIFLEAILHYYNPFPYMSYTCKYSASSIPISISKYMTLYDCVNERH